MPGCFAEIRTSGHARLGKLRLAHATVKTPAFMPVGTQASVKSLTPQEVEGTGARLILGNTYHLWLRPGPERIARLGGLRDFMAWPHATLTDSGGYQVFSLAKLRKVSEEGVTFRSHLDGSKHILTPEKAMEVQALLGSDIAMVLDVCPPGKASREEVQAAMKTTTAWAQRCLAVPAPNGQLRFGIVQGGTHLDLRLEHLAQITSLPFSGIALGGFSVGEPIDDMVTLLHAMVHRMPADKPRYLMGVGKPSDLLRAIEAGVDMFDCVLPTRNARNGQALTWRGRVNLHQARHMDDEAPLDDRCGCDTCRTYSRAYLRHLFVAKEMLGPRLLTLHNLSFYAALMREAQDAIADDRYSAWCRNALADMAEGDEVGAPDIVKEAPAKRASTG